MTIAIVVSMLAPVVAFYLGKRYEKMNSKRSYDAKIASIVEKRKLTIAKKRLSIAQTSPFDELHGEAVRDEDTIN